MNTRNSNSTIWVDTHRVTLAEFESDVAYPLETRNQGRDASNPVGRFSMLAGKPIANEEATEHAARALFWQSYVSALALFAVCAFLLAVWPN